MSNYATGRDVEAQRQVIAERRNLIDERTLTIRRVWEMGRSDRVAGLEPALKWQDDFYYMAGYNGERRKENDDGLR